mmetsp:Transcript_2288/g.2952  ORF Transcript_2288/g.2952 Transcript_2288/m.2952 type:complete len:354 (-) Transcript_2288:12-1073(-)|eukprot:CAMPEP_0172497792 /NCGR_PEP_ID=MMETSP1066-20121228/105319_1 /TAXON_ID=671091 /ORGANISM="Coscinodiscus wailesii, Strain CCMP2513" /LENGTH=353 /DNA_ID=CAMNT_0013270763 /DNA_START=139 /DNA_END=1200 /DNA_ORIENTATION=-
MGKGGCAKTSSNDVTALIEERKAKMSNQPSFYWDHDEEPHISRRIKITTDHPEVKRLFGCDPLIKYKVLTAFTLQILSLHLLHDANFLTRLFCCYTLCGSLNHFLGVSVHEISHNLGAKKLLHNRLLALFASLPLGIPIAMSFKRYHMEHHRFQGEDEVDVDVPTEWEGMFFTSRAKKALWVFLQPAFYSLRPLVVSPKSPTMWEGIDYATTIVFDAMIWYCYGTSGLIYLIGGLILGFGLHPSAGHLISEHIVMSKGHETFSYYGPLNWVMTDVGYHNEHHDFPFVPGSRLHRLMQIAPEVYGQMPHYHSWVKVIYDFIMDPKISPFSRTKRVTLVKEEIEAMRLKGGIVKL